ncbi:hypothetical protein RHECNPAF_8900119 [Rhizobium etli CNPAF512]|nr:hypothetical protein RHECNPAF_8900119 [Rhizobium etli CNPAF512]
MVSISFSVPRCKRPICGSTRSTISPSSSRTRRRTPCAAGCCGPKLMLKLRTLCSVMAMGSRSQITGAWRQKPPSALNLLLRFFITGENIFCSLPRRHEVEVAEFLFKLDRLVYDALCSIVVTDFDETCRRKVLAQRMAFEAIVGQDAAQIRMAGEENAVHVPRFAFEPVSTRIDGASGRNGRIFVGCDLDADAQILLRRQQVIDDIEAQLALRPVDTANIDQVDETAFGVVTQEGQKRDQVFTRRRQRQLAILQLRCGDQVAARFAKIGRKLSQGFTHMPCP